MEITIKKDFENKLLNRRELHFLTSYSGKTPSRVEIKEEVSKKLNLNPDTTIVVRITPLYGTMSSEVLVHSYANKEQMGVEQKYIFERLKPKEKKAAPQAQPQPQKEEKAQEKKEEKVQEKEQEKKGEKPQGKKEEKVHEKQQEKKEEHAQEKKEEHKKAGEKTE